MTIANTFDSTLSRLGINRSGDSSPQVAASANANATLDQSDFLRLMTAQLNNQDPFEPVDNSQMVAQMAQFSSLAGISEMNSTLKSLAAKLGGTSTTDALQWVGRNVLTAGDVAFGRTTGGLQGAVELPEAAGSVMVSIADADGRLLKTIDLGAQPAGTASYEWDGKDAAGEDAGAGPFSIQVTALGTNGPVAAQPLVWAPVNSVSVSNGEAILNLPGLGQVPASAVRSIG
ncbi:MULTISPECIES: flagellar hook assembly protein FlgD [unclassified Sphingomonas]|jgi:flagellar basal-body rod modification protein FlgD|uniref:flagellar hook assembly protein FlgD n=1 Tax=unclassified Sphingomonas TaxID=196159 RepID=UPI000AC0AD02|nr:MULTISPECIES: flagellar hook assembly protein FlgD [unclassified Sphingomonas]